MTTVEREANPAADSPDRPIGFGRMQRKEDPRFVRGKGRYVDDITLPGMLHGAILRSPLGVDEGSGESSASGNYDGEFANDVDVRDIPQTAERVTSSEEGSTP